MTEEPPINSILRRSDELLLAHDVQKPRGGGKLPHDPYEIIREQRVLIWDLANMLASACQDRDRAQKEFDQLLIQRVQTGTPSREPVGPYTIQEPGEGVCNNAIPVPGQEL